MSLFSERNGYVKVSDILITEDVPDSVANVICCALDGVGNIMNREWVYEEYDCLPSEKLETYILTHFLNKRMSECLFSRRENIEKFITSHATSWYRKLDLVEFVLEYIKDLSAAGHDYFVNDLNMQFKRLNFGYMIVADQIVERMAEPEIESVEVAINTAPSTVKEHLIRALELYSQRPDGDYSNSIKESISAFECACRKLTGSRTLGESLRAFDKKGILLHPRLKDAFVQMYAYTNQPDTGIRHAMMDNDAAYVPSLEEAQYFMVTCSAFVNYLNAKLLNEKL